MNRGGVAATRGNNERVTNDETRRKMAEESAEFGPRKTIIVLAIVAGCFAILWPKIFYPMISTPVSTLHTPADGPACCDVIFESDVNTVDIMQEMCKNILRHHQVDPRVRDALQSGKLTPQSASFCRDEVLARCGIDLSSFLAEKERLGKTYKQVLEEIRSFNSSLCLKMQFGVPLSQLGTPHLIRYHILMPHSPIRQERRTPPHAGGLHPALRERGRAIPSSHIVPKVSGRPDHVVVQKMRPPMGAAGRVVPAPSGNSSMGIIMPLYTLGIVLFFLYTIAKVMRKNEDNAIYAEYQNPAAEREFRNKVFSPEALSSAITGVPYYRKERRSPSPRRPTPTIEELKELDGAPKSNGPAGVPQSSKLQDECTSRSCCSRSHNGVEEHDESSSTVKVMGMEMTACCEGGQKISRPTTPIISQAHSQPERELTPPKPIFLEGALPPQCELLVTDSETQAEQSEDDNDAPVVLSGKMTLSLISHDQAETEEKSLEVAENCKRIEAPLVDIAADGGSRTKREVKMVAESEDEVEEDEEDEEEDEDSDDEEEEEEEEEEDDEEENDNQKNNAVKKVEPPVQTAKQQTAPVVTKDTEDEEEDEEEDDESEQEESEEESEEEEEEEDDNESEEDEKVTNQKVVAKEAQKDSEEEEEEEDDDEGEEEDEEEEESSEENASDEEPPKRRI